MVKDIAHICIGARDLDATDRFYREGLGMRKRFDFLKEGCRCGFYLEVAPGRYIECFRKDPVEPGDRHPIVHLCLEVDDIDAVRASLAKIGADMTAKRLGADHSWQAWTTDPNGVRIEFHQYTPQSCQLTGADCLLP